VSGLRASDFSCERRPTTAESPKLFRAGRIEYDEARAALLVDGQRRALEAKPLVLLHALLRHGGAVATKQSLLEAVWGNADHTSVASLANAISKIRTVLGDAGRDLIEAVHGSGYRINAEVDVVDAPKQPALSIMLRAREAVPHRRDWRLVEAIGDARPERSWLASQDGGDGQRIYKFAESADDLARLRRMAEASRALQRALGTRDDLVAVEDRQFAKSPYTIATARSGVDLASWAAARGGLAAVPLDARLDILIQAARALAAAHSAGVLHDGLKPANILVSPKPDQGARVRLVDFSGAPAARHGAEASLPEPASAITPYAAPERPGAGATIATDLYGLGVLLYQMVVADLTRPLTIGWESNVGDKLLRQDIAAAAAGDPTRRLTSASDLAGRLAGLATRRAELDERALAHAEAARLRAQADRARMRRPWIAAAATSIVLGASLAVGFGFRAVHDRDVARRRAELAQSVNAFLTVDLLGRGDPALSGKPDETLMHAAEAAEGQIDRRLAHEPAEAGAIYLSLARAYHSRSAYDAARRAYVRAAAFFDRAPDAAAAIIARFQLATMEIESGQPGSLPRARNLIAQGVPREAGLTDRKQEAAVWQDIAQADLDRVAGNAQSAEAALSAAAAGADRMPDIFDEASRLTIRRKLANIYTRQGKWAAARAILVQVQSSELALNGPRHPDTLQAELELAELDLAQNKAEQGLAELDQLYPAINAVFGPDHRATLTLLAHRADALTILGRYDEVQAVEMAIYRATAEKEGPQSWAALGTLTNAAVAQCRAGKAEEGLVTARDAYERAKTAFGVEHLLTQAAAGNMGFCLILAGKPGQAAALLSSIDAAAVSQMMMDATYRGELDLMRAAIAFSGGDRTQGLILLRRAAPLLERPDADPYMKNWMRRLSGGADHTVMTINDR
jgi:DNA-binding winged helix-turn-helix (wHTH) protein